MSSLRNAIPKRPYRERSQPESRKKFGLLEKHKDYVARAKAYHKKEETLRRLKEKAAFRNPDEFYFKMINTKTAGGVHKPETGANKYTSEELMLMKTQDIGYIMQKMQSEEKQKLGKLAETLQKIEKLAATLHSIDNRSSTKHVYYAEDREEAKEIKKLNSKSETMPLQLDLPDRIKRKTASSYRELEARQNRVNELKKIYEEMSLQKELQKKGKKRKLREDEIDGPTTRTVYKWRPERKR